ncbi:MAG: TetR/AcrR family transcriptional regulator [Methylomonas sp.]|nr:TetR/AcrR family transcriptional regulator [Methylomonas sp.]PPD22844.1 MAG: TetR family transcriptional regulator [Methylomonas sp.]PPD25380.1 MAG: TetR family transcriptional regulator [Methylomonas sp.]PPD35395.1 MAG: TetR family transcriptional regulator [Methylomonas sp.]PPD41824.1 MAG: TetR family transcriptional regulator [Methylomonas sp.]
MARRSEHTLEQIRDMVLSAAEAIVSQHGIEALTVRKIAMDIGYTVGSIYMVFANMNDLEMHIKGRVLDELADSLRDCKGCESPQAEIQVMADHYLEFARQHVNRWRMIFDADGNQSLPAWYLEKIDALFDLAAQPLHRLMPERSHEDVTLATRALWSGVHGVCLLSLNGSLGRAGAQQAGVTLALLVDSFICGWQQPAPRLSPQSVTPP